MTVVSWLFKPLQIIEVKTSKTGKHGHAKCNITGVCVVTGKKYNVVQPSHAQMQMVVVEKPEYQFTYADEYNPDDGGDYTVHCMTEDCVEKEFTISAEEKELIESIIQLQADVDGQLTLCMLNFLAELVAEQGNEGKEVAIITVKTASVLAKGKDNFEEVEEEKVVGAKLVTAAS